jgi:hypothetical protein
VANLLRVARPLELAQVAVGVDSAQEDRLELVHARVCEEQRRVAERHDAARGLERMLLGLEKVREGLAHFIS